MPITMKLHSSQHHQFTKTKYGRHQNKKETTLQVKGRHDPCVVPRAPPVVDSLVALTIADHALISGQIKPVL